MSGEPAGTLGVLTEFYTDKLTAVLEHRAHARLITQYDANNTYQYVINREEVQLDWLANAIADAGGMVPEDPREFLLQTASGKDAAHTIFQSDARGASLFIELWRPRVEAMENARHRAMLQVILGETREQQRFFEQALAGRTDLLGRRSSVAGPAHGEVLPARWIE